MKKNNYYAPKMEQVRMEAEMPVMAGSSSNGPISLDQPTGWNS